MTVALLQRAVEELLRWDSPVQLDGRMVLRDTEIEGQRLAPGDQVMTLLGAANRDPRRFRDPETLDLARDEGAPMSFGSGITTAWGRPSPGSRGRCASVACSPLPAHRAHRPRDRGFATRSRCGASSAYRWRSLRPEGRRPSERKRLPAALAVFGTGRRRPVVANVGPLPRTGVVCGGRRGSRAAGGLELRDELFDLGAGAPDPSIELVDDGCRPLEPRHELIDVDLALLEELDDGVELWLAAM